MLTRIIDRSLSALFRMADYVTSWCPLSKGVPTGNNPHSSIIRFSKEDVLMD
ncbi:MAG: hypothetical protein J6W56_05655 [Prevotella sp.]|nr:hypothetical protein [Prevotella sp.]